MVSIEDFINHRWQDAKAQLSEIAPDFVQWVDSTVGLEAIGLAPPWETENFPVPSRRLPKKWHRLLQACYEMVMHMTMLRVAAEDMTAEANKGLPSNQAGRRFLHHQAAWLAHAEAVAEAAGNLISLTIAIYVKDIKKGKEVAKRRKQQVHDDIIQQIKKFRNDHIHPARMVLASGITEDGLWEGLVAFELAPQTNLIQYVYPPLGEKLKTGGDNPFSIKAEEMLEHIGLILKEMEAEILSK